MQCFHCTLIIQPHYRVKQLLLKLQFSHVVLVLKSKEKVEMRHFRLPQLANSSKPCKNSLFQDMFKVSAPRFHTISSKSFYKAQYGLVDGVLWQIIPYCLQAICTSLLGRMGRRTGGQTDGQTDCLHCLLLVLMTVSNKVWLARTTHRHIHTQADRQIHRQTDRDIHIDRQRDRYIHTNRRRYTQTERQTDIHTEIQTYTHRQTDRQTAHIVTCW